jgi:DNA repair protein RadC
MQQHFFSFESGELQNNKTDSSSHCSSVQERLVTYGSEALDTTEHLGLILGSQKAADSLLKHFGSLAVLARASVEELLPFVPRSKALRLVSSLRMGAVALREERQSLTIDGPEAITDLCSEMRFLDREWLRVVLLNVKQQLIKVATVSQGSINESLAHPREVFKPAIVLSAYSFIMVHNHPSGDPSPSEADMRLTRRILEASRILQINLLDHVIIGAPAPGRSNYFSFKEGGVISGVNSGNGNLRTLRGAVSSWKRVRSHVMRNAGPLAQSSGSSSISFPVKRAVIEFWCVLFSSDDSWNALTYVIFLFLSCPHNCAKQHLPVRSDRS